MSDLILGIDIGTASAKVIAFDLMGAEVASASRPYPLLTPQPGWVEQDAEQVWQALLDALREVAGRTADHRIVSLALAAQAGSIIPADERGDPVHPMITWLDRRTDDLVARWRRDGTAERIRQLSGWHPFPGLPLPVIAWLAAERPDVHARARRYLGVADFLNHRLTGRFATDLSAACEILLVAANTGEWSPELCAIGGVDPAMQAELGWAGRLIGPITPEVAAYTGLPADTLVVAGGGDQPAACLGMGMFEPGQVALATGTAWVITGVTKDRRVDQAPPAMDLSFHAAPHRWTVSQFLGGFGATVDWWLQQTWQPPDPAQAQPVKELYRHLNAALADSEPGSHGLLFTPLSGPSQVPGAAPGGVFAGLQLAHTRADMARAILEGCGFEVRWALDELGASGLPTSELWLAGGAAASPIWPQILADISGVPIVVPEGAEEGRPSPPWAALGAAALAGWGAGLFSTLEEGVARLQPPVRRLASNQALAGLYAERYAAYRRLAAATKAAA
ncbi:MAG: xylulokinase [Anaerolineae bacterium]